MKHLRLRIFPLRFYRPTSLLDETKGEDSKRLRPSITVKLRLKTKSSRELRSRLHYVFRNVDNEPKQSQNDNQNNNGWKSQRVTDLKNGVLFRDLLSTDGEPRK